MASAVCTKAVEFRDDHLLFPVLHLTPSLVLVSLLSIALSSFFLIFLSHHSFFKQYRLVAD